MTEDQVFVPKTRAQRGLPEFDPAGEDILGSRVSEKVMNELWEALVDSPIGAAYGAFSYLVCHIALGLLTIAHYGCADVWLAGVPYYQRLWPETVPSWHQPCVFIDTRSPVC